MDPEKRYVLNWQQCSVIFGTEDPMAVVGPFLDTAVRRLLWR
jgi:hypothetical protein